MAYISVEPLLAQTAHEVADAKGKNETHRHFGDGVTSQERLREHWNMPHLSKNDVAIERVAWLVVLGLLSTAMWLAGML